MARVSKTVMKNKSIYLKYFTDDQYFKHPKDIIIQQLEQEIYSLRSKMGNYDILRKQMVELELEYRQLMLSKESTED